MTKKAAALLLAASLAVSVCAMPVFATGTSLPGSKGSGPSITEVKYVVTEAYEWTVPALIDFGKDAGVNEKREVNTTLDKDGTIHLPLVLTVQHPKLLLLRMLLVVSS